MMFAYLYGKLMNRLRGTCVLSSNIDKTSVVGSGCNIISTLIKKYSYCGDDCQIVNTEIGSFCSISDHVFIGGAEHPTNWVSTSPVFQNVRHSGPNKRFARIDLPETKRTIIGNDVWIGHGVTIKQGVIIGHGAVIGSNALVTKDVPPYAIVGGVPSRIIKYRFSDEAIKRILATEWWAISEDKLAAISGKIDDYQSFIECFDLGSAEA